VALFESGTEILGQDVQIVVSSKGGDRLTPKASLQFAPVGG